MDIGLELELRGLGEFILQKIMNKQLLEIENIDLDRITVSSVYETAYGNRVYFNYKTSDGEVPFNIFLRDVTIPSGIHCSDTYGSPKWFAYPSIENTRHLEFYKKLNTKIETLLNGHATALKYKNKKVKLTKLGAIVSEAQDGYLPSIRLNIDTVHEDSSSFKTKFYLRKNLDSKNVPTETDASTIGNLITRGSVSSISMSVSVFVRSSGEASVKLSPLFMSVVPGAVSSTQDPFSDTMEVDMLTMT